MKIALLLLATFVMTLGESVTAEEAKGKEELDQLKARLDTLLGNEQQPIRDLKESYSKRLKAIVEKLQAKADLQGVLAVQQEQERIGGEQDGDTSKTTDTGSVKELGDARIIYEREYARLVSTARKRSNPIYEAYRKKLEDLQAGYTKGGDIQSAVLAKEMIDSIPVEEKGALFKPEGNTNLKIRVQIGGTSFLLIQNNQIWFDHTNGTFALPGTQDGEFPTYVNDKIEWLPTWTGKVSDRFDVDIDFPSSGEGVDIHLRNSDGRGHAKIVEQPSKENQYTAKIHLLDESEKGKAFFGTEWMEFRLSW